MPSLRRTRRSFPRPRRARGSVSISFGILALAGLAMALLQACAFHWEPAYQEVVPAERFESVDIADPNEALTFARTREPTPRLLAVRSYQKGRVEAVDLGLVLGGDTDPIRCFRQLGYDGLRARIAAAPAQANVSVAAGELGLPIDLGNAHVAAGTNFPEHAGESGVERGPFLFPKLVRPSAADASVPASSGLLDYEVELALVPLASIGARDRPDTMGVILCNDYTDRDSLLRHADPWDVESGKGFTTGKSFPGYLPIGNLFVIPRDVRRFVPEIELALYVNRSLRQRAYAREMIWDVDELLRQTWSRSDRVWEHDGGQVSLLGKPPALEERTLLLTGTPHGTVFQGITSAQKLRGFVGWLLGGWKEPLPAHVIEAYVHDARLAGIYLVPGDEVVIHVDRLGVIRNRIVEPS